MTDLEYFAWLLEQTVGVILYLWPVTGYLLAGWVVFEWRAWDRGAGRIRDIALQIVLLTVPLVMLGIGSIYACENCSPSSLGQGVRHEWAGDATFVLLLLQIGIGGWFITRARGRRWPTALLQLLLLWCSLMASFVAGMSISGDWI